MLSAFSSGHAKAVARRNLSRPDENLSRHGKNGVANGTRTRNSQNHNLGLYH